MNSKSFPSATQSLLNSSYKTFKFNTNHVKITNNNSIQPRNINITTKASATAAHRSLTPTPGNETLYDLLGISENVTLSEIKQAYKKMALKYHPDVSPPDRLEEYTVMFIRVQEAYETLSDPDARSMYDSCMAKGIAYFSGRKDTRCDPRSNEKKRWKETWTGQTSELQRRNTKADRTRGMSWADRIRKQRSESCLG